MLQEIARRQYELSRVNEVAAVFSDQGDGSMPPAYIVITSKDGKRLKVMKPIEKSISPLLYPLLFPNGTPGYNVDMELTNGKRLSMRDYASRQLSIASDGAFNPLLHAGSLTQQFVLDLFTRIEFERLDYLRNNQSSLNVASYKNIMDQMHSDAEQCRVGKRIILPSSYPGSPRNMYQHYQDAMAMVSQLGPPDIFLTMTLNPNDEDIKKTIKDIGGDPSKPYYYPHIVVRIAYLKFQKLLEEVVKNKIFGRIIGWVHVIEFQKRGLPHMHALFTLAREAKWKTPEKIDEHIRAYVDPEDDDELRELIRRYMLHGPCGMDKPNCPCMIEKDGKLRCSKEFPKQFCDETKVGEDGYCQYRRSDNGEEFMKDGTPLDNRFVVPFNPYLLRRFQCHINVERCNSISGVKYLYKYVYKGYDKCEMDATYVSKKEALHEERREEQSRDEIQEHLDFRFLCPCEACWRIFAMEMQEKSHAIERLPVHLRDQQVITLEGDEAPESEDDPIFHMPTKLTAYFTYNATLPEEERLLYNDLPRHCLWEFCKRDGIAKWRKRKSVPKPTLGRMYTVSPSQSEAWHLRILLHHVKPTRWDDLLTHQGTRYPSFAAAALARGLTRDDAEQVKAMEEAVLTESPKEIRRLFAIILLHQPPKKPEEMWETFKESMADDFLHAGYSDDDAIKKVYVEVERFLGSMGSSLEKFPSFPEIDTSEIDEDDVIDRVREKRAYMELRRTIKSDQKEILDEFIRVWTKSRSSSKVNSTNFR